MDSDTFSIHRAPYAFTNLPCAVRLDLYACPACPVGRHYRTRVEFPPEGGSPPCIQQGAYSTGVLSAKTDTSRFPGMSHIQAL